MKIIIVIGLILLVGCGINIEAPCSLGWSNESHFCNEFHKTEAKLNKINETDLLFSNISNVPIEQKIFLECTDVKVVLEYDNYSISLTMYDICNIFRDKDEVKDE